MSSAAYRSALAGDIEGFLAHKRSLGYAYESGEMILRRFDAHCADGFPDERTITREMAMSWVELDEGASPNTRVRKTSPVRGLAEYMCRHGKDAYVIPRGSIAAEVQYEPYIYTHEELAKLFEAADRLATSGPGGGGQRGVFPCALRLLYATGMRQGEARELRRGDVDLGSGSIAVGPCKASEGRIVYLSDEVAGAMSAFDAEMERLAPGRGYFFSTLKGTAMASSWLRGLFEAAKCLAGIDEPGVIKRVHDLRHTFCVHRLNAWVAEGKDARAMLPYLSAYVGHKEISSTDYYLHLVPEFFPDYSGLVSKRRCVIPSASGVESDG